jgi:hypothetical protein
MNQQGRQQPHFALCHTTEFWKLSILCILGVFFSEPLRYACQKSFCAKVGMEDIFKTTVASESLYEISNANGVRLVNFATSKNLTVENTTSPHPNIH